MKAKILTAIIFSLVLISACKKDGNLIQVTGIAPSELMSSETSVVLTKETSANSVLALTWSASNLSVSDKSMTLPGSVPKYTIEVSATTDFGNMVKYTPSATTYAFTGEALNTLGKTLGFKSGVSTPMYFRINSALGGNTQSYYSNVVTVNVTCYSLDMTLGFILDSKKADTGFKLYSPNSDGEYYGFTGASAWGNWFLLEGDGTIWGNLGIDGNAFVASNDQSSFWNFWYPGQSGCYYTTLSRTNKEWTATYIPSLTVNGGVNATMTFDKTAVKWTASFTTTTDNATIKVNGTASLYNKTTSTTDASAIAKTIGFIANSDSTLSFDWNSSAATNINISKAGDYTLTFYLVNPKAWTYSVKSGKTVVVAPLSKYLYLPGIDDGITGPNWNFNNYLKLVSDIDSTYAGTILVNSLYGYEMTLTSGDWTNVYQMGGTAGILKFKSGTNITAPSAGLYLIQADLKHLTYNHTAITSLSYSGLNGDWSGLTAMDATSKAGVYSSSVTINSVSQYGTKLYLNGGWDYFYGGSNGVLSYNGSGITDDATIGNGSYDLIADIRDTSYVFLGNEVYISGINDDWTLGSSMTLSKTSIGVYSGTITITKSSTYGITIQIDKTWKRFYGGSFTSLRYLGANITDDQSLAIGTYNVTVDFINNKCSFTAKK